MEEAVIQCHNVSKEYAKHPVLSRLNLNIQKGKIHALLGPNGAGKTTLMRLLTGLLRPSEGTLSVVGSIGYLPEHNPLYLEMKVKDYLLFMGRIHGRSDLYLKKRMSELLSEISLTAVENRLLGHLSKGMRQRVGLCALLLWDPDVLILDEPTTGLDASSILEMRELLQRLKGSHTILLSTHQLHEAELLCDELSILNKGQILFTGTRQEAQKKLGHLAHQRFNIELQATTSETLEILQKLSCVESVSVKRQEGDHLFLECLLRGQSEGEKKELLSSITASQERIGELVSFSEQQLPLESIFVRMMEEQKK